MILAATAALADARAQQPADAMAAHTFTSQEHGSLPYRLFTPPAAKADAPLPLVLFLHGAGERGTDNEAQLTHGVKPFVAVANQKARPCWVVAPQCPTGRWWDVDLLLAFAEELRGKAGVDRERVYLTGLSMGGFATWHMIGRRPELFAAAVPVCGGGEAGQAKALVDLPIWAFHGDADRVVPVAQSRTMIEAIRKAGGQPQYTEYPGVQHDSWTKTYADVAVHEWLFAQRRAPQPTPIALHDGDRVVFFGDSITEAAVEPEGYITELGTLLRAKLPEAKIELLGAGISGNRVPDLQARIERDVLAKQPTVVVIYIGINDVWHSQSGRGTPKDAYAAGLRQLVERLRTAKARVLLCTPTVIGEKRSGTNKLDAMLDEYAALSRQVATTTGAQLLDLRALFVAHLQEHNAADAKQGVLTSDGVHLNAAGNRFVAERLGEALLRQ